MRKVLIYVSLETVIDAIETADNAYTYFYDTQTLETVYISDFFITGQRDEKLEELIDNNPERFMRFPTKFEIHDYSIMESFILSYSNSSLRDRLLSAIKGRGAFRKFKDLIIQFEIEEEWYKYQETAYKKIAILWCRDNDLEYEE